MVEQIFHNSREICYKCELISLIIDPETGEAICSNCGTVLSERPNDFGLEWRSFSDGKLSRERGGSPTSLRLHDMGLATIINPQNKDATGKPLTIPMRRSIHRLRIWDNRSQAFKPVTRNLRYAFTELNKLKDKLAISDFVIEKAAYIYRKAVERKLVRGRKISTMIAASLYAACRNTGTPRTLKDISQAGNLEKREIAKCYRIIHRELGLKMPVFDSVNCVARISSRLDISEKIKRRATEILKLCQECEKSAGKDPMGLAAAALYMSCIENSQEITQREIAEVAKVTEVTVRNRYKILKKDHGINKDFGN